MRVIYNRIIPFGTFKAINLFGVVFSKMPLSATECRHEQIHSRQMLELCVVGFYLWYVVEWGIRLLQYRNGLVAYFNICFEREAYLNQSRPDYLMHRRCFGFWRYLRGETLLPHKTK